MYVFQAFPKWKYSAGQEPVIVHSQAEEMALGAAWVDSPALVQEQAPSDSPDLVEEAAEIVLEAQMPKKRGRKAKLEVSE